MTIRALIKKLQKIEKEIGPRAPVTIKLEDLMAFSKANDEYSHWELNDAGSAVILWYKDDSCELADGSQREKAVVVLS